MTSSSPLEELNELAARLAAAAESVGFSPVAAVELERDVFKGGEGTDVARLPATDLPDTVRALSFGRYMFILGLLPVEPSPASIADCVRRFRNQCVVARSYLTPNQALDLQGLLMGPRASEPSDEWRAMSLMVERDDRVARKFVWLRPTNPEGDDISFADLLKRTVLARPWISGATFTMAALDNLNRVAAESQAAVPRDTVDRWVSLSLTVKDDPDKLVEELIKAWNERGSA
ncbi:ABC-three component system middle component 1 [Phenylobacterium sp.]|uniref:ABC-three component system middle component 1 n=1 Tax=Phenylobacterium sp. TaxID=1871053 RepID=UPI003BACB4FD